MKRLLFGFALIHSAYAAVFPITSTADNGPGTLRDALQTILTTSADAVDSLDFSAVAGMTITLNANSPLPIVSSTMVAVKTIDFTNGGGVVLDGNGNQGLFIAPILPAGTLTSSIDGITFQNCASVGGAGGSSTTGNDCGGGAMGAGGAVMAAHGSAVTITNCAFNNCSATGGAGGSPTAGIGVESSGTGGGGYGPTAAGSPEAGGGGGFYTPGGIGAVGGGGGGGAFFIGGPTVFGTGGNGNLGGGGGGGSATSALANGITPVGDDGGAGGEGITGVAGGAGGIGGAPPTAGGAGATFAGGGGGGRSTSGTFGGAPGGSAAPTGGGGGGGGGIFAGLPSGGSGGAGGPYGGGGGGALSNFGSNAGGAGGIFGGGGGGHVVGSTGFGNGGNGGFGGGGGAGSRDTMFGGGGIGGNGGFGGGSGGGRTPGLAGTDAGFAGGHGTGAVASGGGGGAGLGGAIFVAPTATLSIGTGNTFSGNAVTGGAAGVSVGASPASAGTGQGADLYVHDGSLTATDNVTLTGSLAVPPGTQFTKIGAGDLTLSTASRITAQVNVNGGTLSVSADDQLGTGTAVAIGAAGTLSGAGSFATAKTINVVAGSSIEVDPTFTFMIPVIQGAGGSVTKTGTGVLEVTGTSTYDGGTTINVGTVSLGNAGALLATGPVANNATFDISGVAAATAIGPLSGAGTGTVALGARTLTVNSTGASTYAGTITDGGISGGTGGMLVKAGADVLTMTGSSTFTGGVCISSGTLAFSGTGSFSPDGTMVNNAILDISQITGTATVPSLSGAGTVALGSRTLQTGSADNTQYDGVIQDQPAIVGGVGGSLNKVGSGILTLTALNTFTGTSGVTSGTLALSGIGAIPQATVNVDGTFDVSQITPATTTIGDLTGNGIINLGAKGLTVGTASSTTYGGTINDGGLGGGTAATFTKEGAGTLTLTGVSTYTGNTIVNTGTLAIAAAGALAPQGTTTVNSILDVSQVTTSTTISSLAGAGAVNLGSRELISGSPSSTTFAGTINDGGIAGGTGGSFTKAGTGTMTLTGVNTYTGNTTITTGTLALSGGGSLVTTTNVIANDTFDVSQIAPGTITIGDLSGGALGMVDLGSKGLLFGTATSSTYSGTINDGGLGGGAGAAITKMGTGVQTLEGVNTYSGGTTITGGTLALANAGALLATGDVTANATFDISQITAGSTSIGALSGLGNIFLGSKTLDTTNAGAALISGPITDGGIGGGTGGAFIKNGAGTLTLTGTNTYTGGTTVTAGILEGNTDSVQGNILNNANVTFDQAVMGTYAGAMTGTGSLIKNNAGTLVMTGANTYSGGSTINAGCMQGNSSSIQGGITNNSCLIFDQDINGTYAGVMTGAGTMDKNNAGMLEISGASPGYTGMTTVNAGELNVNGVLGGPVVVTMMGTLSGEGTVGDVMNSGTISPGNSIGTINVGMLTLTPSSNLDIEINGAGMSDLIAATGAATIDGNLNVIFLPGVYLAGTTYEIITAGGGVAGTFATITENQPDFDIQDIYLPNAVRITLLPPPTILIFTGTGGTFTNPNTQAVATNINSTAGGSASDDLDNNFIAPLAGSNIDVIGDALNRLQPSQFSSYYEQSVEISNFLASQFHASSLSYCCPDPCKTIVCRYQNGNAWVQPYSYYYRLKPFNDQIPSFNSLNAGVILGIDGPVSENWLLGFGGAYNYDKINWSDARGDATLNSGFLSAYTEWTNDLFFWGTTFLGGFDYISTDRDIRYLTVDETAKSSHFGFEFLGQFEAGLAIKHERLDLVACPYAKFNYIFFHQNGTTESGADGASLEIRSNNAQTFVSELGLQFQKIFYLEDGCIAPLIGFNWILEKPIDRNPFTVNFVNLPVPFNVVGYDRFRNIYSFPVQVSATHKSWSVILGYTPKFGSYFWGQDGSLQINYAF